MQFDRGGGKIKFIGLSRRSAEFATREDWIRYWVDVHGPLAHGIPEFTRYYGRYVHNYVLPSDVGSRGRDPEYDGIVEEWLDSVEAFAQCLSEPKYLELVRPDELVFVDFARSHMLVTRGAPALRRRHQLGRSHPVVARVVLDLGAAECRQHRRHVDAEPAAQALLQPVPAADGIAG